MILEFFLHPTRCRERYRNLLFYSFSHQRTDLGGVISKQDAQLSQRDRAAGCVIVFAKSRPLELGDYDLRT